MRTTRAVRAGRPPSRLRSPASPPSLRLWTGEPRTWPRSRSRGRHSPLLASLSLSLPPRGRPRWMWTGTRTCVTTRDIYSFMLIQCWQKSHYLFNFEIVRLISPRVNVVKMRNRAFWEQSSMKRAMCGVMVIRILLDRAHGAHMRRHSITDTYTEISFIFQCINWLFREQTNFFRYTYSLFSISFSFLR